MSLGLPSVAHCAHLLRLAFIMRWVGGARSGKASLTVKSIELFLATCSTRTNCIENYNPLLLSKQSPNPSLMGATSVYEQWWRDRPHADFKDKSPFSEQNFPTSLPAFCLSTPVSFLRPRPLYHTSKSIYSLSEISPSFEELSTSGLIIPIRH